MTQPTIIVIMGSTRAQRIGPDVARWVVELGEGAMAAAFEIIDLREWHLPMDDEPGIPAKDGYLQPHTKAWSDKVASADAIVFVTPQYNWGYPAPLKNAIDHLYKEWAGKPAVIVTYGGHGGGKCAAQLQQVLTGLKMRVVETMPALQLSEEQVFGNLGMIEAKTAFASHKPAVIGALVDLASQLASPRVGSSPAI
jgi:NAD(P)H-dependent FMN reductase